MSSQPLVSYVIPQCGRRHMLLDTVASLLLQELSGEEAEIIVVTQDDYLSLDGTLDSHRTEGQATSVNIIYSDKSKVISHSRNLGAQYTSGKYIAFIDADVVLSPDWTRRMIEVLDGDNDSILAGGSQILSNDAGTVEMLRAAMNNLNNDMPVTYLPGHNLFLLRTTFDCIGGFPEHLITCEDVWFTGKAREYGLVWKSATATFVHLGEDQFFGMLFQKEIWRSCSNIQSLTGRKFELREIPSLVVPPLSLLFVLVILIALIMTKPGIALIALLLLLVAPITWALRLKTSKTQPVRLLPAIWLYLLYFTARGIGMIAGLLRNPQSMKSTDPNITNR
jgi:GT2 family glycosyltransferase